MLHSILNSNSLFFFREGDGIFEEIARCLPSSTLASLDGELGGQAKLRESHCERRPTMLSAKIANLLSCLFVFLGDHWSNPLQLLPLGKSHELDAHGVAASRCAEFACFLMWDYRQDGLSKNIGPNEPMDLITFAWGSLPCLLMIQVGKLTAGERISYHSLQLSAHGHEKY